MTKQTALTIQAPILPGEMQRLREVLRLVDTDIEANELVPFGRLNGVHFARFVILDESKDVHGVPIAPTLIYACNVDGSADAHFSDILDTASSGLDRIYSCCIGYPPLEARTQASRLGYLQTRRINSQAFYVNTVGLTVTHVKRCARLRDLLETFLNSSEFRSRLSARPSIDSAQIRLQCESHARQRLGAEWPSLSDRPQTAAWRFEQRIVMLLTLLAAIVLLPLLVIVLGLWLIAVRLHEADDPSSDYRLSSLNRDKLQLREDQVVQNQFSAVGNIKPGLFRYMTLRALLLAVDFGSRHVYNNGDLGTVRPLGLVGVNTIHFAQWIVIDNNRRVLFISNYDGSLVSYMDDFINEVAWGLNAVFSNGYGYPPTKWLFTGGANFEQPFKAYMQAHQIETQAWFSGYKRLSAMNIQNNDLIRAGLISHMNEAQSAAWLSRL